MAISLLQPAWPVWWHHHGMKMRVESADSTGVLISGSAAGVLITKVYKRNDLYVVDWWVDHGIGRVSGTVNFSQNNLRCAFGLKTEVGTGSKWLIDEYGGDSAHQFAYIRSGKHLNIPCPGTGNDGDPNVSIELDASITKAIAKLLK